MLKMNYHCAVELAKNFGKTFRKIKWYNFIFFFIFIIPSTFLFIFSYLGLLVRSLIEVCNKSVVDNDHYLVKIGENVVKFNIFDIPSKVIIVFLNFIIYTIGALYDIFRICATFNVHDLFFLKSEEI